MSNEIFNSKETLLAAETLIDISQQVFYEKITNLSDVEDDNVRSLLEKGIEYNKSNVDKVGGVIGASVGGGLGVASGFGLITLMAVEGTAGATVVTSGLAGIGAIFGGGMLLGIGTLLVIPTALATAGGIVGIILASKNRKDRNKVKEELLIKAEDILSKLISKAQQNNDELIIGTMLTLQALINDLKRDLEV